MSYPEDVKGYTHGHPPAATQSGPGLPLRERCGDQRSQRNGSGPVDRQVRAINSEPLGVLGGQGRPVRDHGVGVTGGTVGEDRVVGVLP